MAAVAVQLLIVLGCGVASVAVQLGYYLGYRLDDRSLSKQWLEVSISGAGKYLFPYLFATRPGN